MREEEANALKHLWAILNGEVPVEEVSVEEPLEELDQDEAMEGNSADEGDIDCDEEEADLSEPFIGSEIQ